MGVNSRAEIVGMAEAPGSRARCCSTRQRERSPTSTRSFRPDRVWVLTRRGDQRSRPHRRQRAALRKDPGFSSSPELPRRCARLKRRGRAANGDADDLSQNLLTAALSPFSRCRVPRFSCAIAAQKLRKNPAQLYVKICGKARKVCGSACGRLWESADYRWNCSGKAADLCGSKWLNRE